MRKKIEQKNKQEKMQREIDIGIEKDKQIDVD